MWFTGTRYAGGMTYYTLLQTFTFAQIQRVCVFVYMKKCHLSIIACSTTNEQDQGKSSLAGMLISNHCGGGHFQQLEIYKTIYPQTKFGIFLPCFIYTCSLFCPHTICSHSPSLSLPLSLPLTPSPSPSLCLLPAGFRSSPVAF